MENFAIYPHSSYVKPFEKSPSPSRTTDSLHSLFTGDGLDFLDNMDDIFSKDSNSPQIFSQIDSNSTTSILETSKHIQKPPKEHKVRKSRDMAYVAANAFSVHEKRNAKKPVHEYEETRKQEEERRKTKRIHKTKEKIKENLAKDVPSSSVNAGIFATSCPLISYKNRDYKMVFNQELSTLSHQEFIIFFGLVYERNPECVSFEKGHAELRILQTQESGGNSPNVSRMNDENVIYQRLCDYIEEVKKMRN